MRRPTAWSASPLSAGDRPECRGGCHRTEHQTPTSIETLIFRRDGDDLRRATLAELALKHWVRVWFEGPTLGSDPVQGAAAQLVIVGFQSQ